MYINHELGIKAQEKPMEDIYLLQTVVTPNDIF